MLDASVALAWVLPDEAETMAAGTVIARVAREGATVPALWRSEVGNGLLIAHRRDRLTEEALTEAMTRLAGLPIAIDALAADHAWTAAMSLARWHGLTLYDAIYLEIAARLALPLATLDRQLRRCAADDGVAILPA